MRQGVSAIFFQQRGLFNEKAVFQTWIKAFFISLRGFYTLQGMKRYFIIALAFCFLLSGCQNGKESRRGMNAELLHRDFYGNLWERFDYVKEKVTIKENTTFDLNLHLSFTDDYPYDNISLVFTVFDEDGTPYRSKGYKFTVKDKEGNWKTTVKDDGSYTFELPINKSLQISEPGVYCFQMEYRMPKTPIIGIKSLTLYNNNLK